MVNYKFIYDPLSAYIPESLDQDEICKVVQIHKGLEHSLVEVVALAQVVSDSCLVETLTLVQEARHVFVRRLQQSVLDEELYPLFGVHVELLAADRHLLRPRVVFAATEYQRI